MSRNPPIPEDVANKIYDVVVEELPLKELVDDDIGMSHWRYNFVRYATEGTWTEYRIGGPLGFGGKLWFNAQRWYVNCYPEDKTPKKQEIIDRVNVRLDKLFEEHFGEPPRKTP